MRLLSITKADPVWNIVSALILLSTQFAPASAAEPVDWKPVGKSDLSDIPDPPREFRGVWIATVYNLDWPSKPGLPVAVQKAELKGIFDRAKELNLNAVVFQVRTMCDALYDSPLEPWSYYLTGKVGKKPDPFYDPLEFAVEEAHKRGLELHAWINPYRALTGYYGDGVPNEHISASYPWLVHKKGGHSWLDPSSTFVRNRVLTIAFDIVNRYNVDGLHLDDYFYPYPGKGEYEGNLDDEENWSRFKLNDEENTEKADWRRENVNELIKNLYLDIKRHRPWVKVGISPFGIWKTGTPENIRGLSSYSQIFTDSRKWLREGWVDYFSPQLYWKNEGPQSFMKLYDWWQEENVHGRHIWPGIATSRIGDAKTGGGESDGRDAVELLEQISHTREKIAGSPASGQLHWHWEAFATNRGGISRMITKNRYADRALTPDSPWLAGQGAENEPEEPAPLPKAVDISLIENPAIAAARKLKEEIAKAEAEAAKSKKPGDDEKADKSSAAAEKANAEAKLAKAGKTGDLPDSSDKGGDESTASHLITWKGSEPNLKPNSHARWWAVQIQTGEGEEAEWRLHDIKTAKGTTFSSPIEDPEKITQIAIRSVDRIGNLGEVVSILKKSSK